jgi:DNA-binding CsgD family transcriptional regulator
VKKIEFKDQELKVLKLICRQMTAKEIGDKLGLSYRTVEGYRDNIIKKIGAKNSVGIVIYAVRKGIIRI